MNIRSASGETLLEPEMAHSPSEKLLTQPSPIKLVLHRFWSLKIDHLTSGAGIRCGQERVAGDGCGFLGRSRLSDAFQFSLTKFHG
jgi:hypothetical protein